MANLVNPVKKEDAKFVVSGQTYKVTKAKEEVSFVAAKKNAKNIVIPATVANKGVTYKVTSIAAKAIKANKNFLFLEALPIKEMKRSVETQVLVQHMDLP